MKRLLASLLILASLAAASVSRATDCYTYNPATGAWVWNSSCGSTPSITSGVAIITAGKTFTVNNTLTLLGTDGSSLNIGAGGTLGALSFLSTAPIANGGTGQTTQQAAINALAGGVGTGYYLRGNGTNAALSLLQASDITTALGAATYDAYGAAAGVQTNLNTHAAAASGVHGVAGTIVGTSDTQTLTNKTIGSGSTWQGNAIAFSYLSGVQPAGSYVSQSTTVNGHALSANVTVSASDITTGTLPHAQLPTLLGTDIPVFGASGSGHAQGAVPDPGASAGSTRYLREDQTWAAPSGSGTLNAYGTPTQYQWGWWNSASTLGGASVTASKVACSDSSGKPIACSNLTDTAIPTPVSSTKTGNYTVQASDFPGSITMSCSSACTLTFPAPSTITSRGELIVTSVGAGAVSWALPASTYLWGTTSGFNLNTGTITGVPHWWTDGTNWYASPISIPFSEAHILGGGSATSWTSFSTGASVPLGAKAVWGRLSETTNGYAGFVAPLSNGNGSTGMGGTMGMIVPFRMPLLVDRTLYYTTNGGGLDVFISGYEF